MHKKEPDRISLSDIVSFALENTREEFGKPRELDLAERIQFDDYLWRKKIWQKDIRQKKRYKLIRDFRKERSREMIKNFNQTILAESDNGRKPNYDPKVSVNPLYETINVLRAAVNSIVATIGLRSVIVKPPGSFAYRVLSFLFSKKTFELTFIQAIEDMREEHANALANSKYWHARWIVIRGHGYLGLTVVTYLAANVVKTIVGIWKIIP